jgi:hypothetical protein
MSQALDASLADASSQRGARRAIESFLEAFGDPHLRTESWRAPSEADDGAGEWTGPASTVDGEEAADVLGYADGDRAFGLPFSGLEGFTRIAEEGPFRSGILEVGGGGTVGVVRISHFGEDRYRDVAVAEWAGFARTLDGPMDSSDWWAFTHRVRRRLLTHLAARIERLEQAGADALLVDVTGNGGGTEWAVDVARLLSTRPLSAPPTGFVRHDHWRGPIEAEIADLRSDHEQIPPGSALRAPIAQVLAAHERLLREIDAPCEPAIVWSTPPSERGCERLSFDAHGGHAVPPGAEAEVAGLASAEIVFPVASYPEFVGAARLPLFVLIDEGSASATEQFATILQHSGAAVVVGEPSLGAGCGYTYGGIDLVLESVELRVRMPDCMRMTAAGTNELAGVRPDLRGWDDARGGRQRVRQLAEVLEGALKSSRAP